MTALTRNDFNDPTRNTFTGWAPHMWEELPAGHRAGFAAWLNRVEKLLGHGVDAEWHEHPNPEDGHAGDITVAVHALHFAEPGERPWLLSLRGQVPVDPDIAPEWAWAWDSGDNEMLWETAPELDGWGWPTESNATDVLTLPTREQEKWDDGLANLHDHA